MQYAQAVFTQRWRNMAAQNLHFHPKISYYPKANAAVRVSMSVFHRGTQGEAKYNVFEP